MPACQEKRWSTAIADADSKGIDVGSSEILVGHFVRTSPFFRLVIMAISKASDPLVNPGRNPYTVPTRGRAAGFLPCLIALATYSRRTKLEPVTMKIQPGKLFGAQSVSAGLGVDANFFRSSAAHQRVDIQWLAKYIGGSDLRHSHIPGLG